MATEFRRDARTVGSGSVSVAGELAFGTAGRVERQYGNGILSAAIRAQKYTIAAAMLQRAVRRPEVNVGLELVALSFCERLADGLAADDASGLLSWVEKTCVRYSGMTVVARLIAAGISTVTKVIADYDGVDGRRADFATLAGDIGAIIARPRLAAELVATDTLDEVDVVLGELIERLEAADPGTAEHSRAVSLWCARIGKRLALSAAQTVFVTRCGLIHDIGKMSTPPEILQAPRRLSAPETNVMRRHAEEGGAIVASIPLLAHHKPAVRWHHERLDGRGYPDGLPAADIPLAARIVSVADSFNAMIGNRPYRLPMRPTAALEELRLHAGTQFDPDVLDAMDDVLTKRP